MTWVRKAPVPSLDGHACALPTKEVTYKYPPLDGTPLVYTETVVDGSFRDLWLCDHCGELWRVGNDCAGCDPAPPDGRRCVLGGYHPGGLKWRPATWWQRFRHRKSGDLSESPPPIKGGPVD